MKTMAEVLDGHTLQDGDSCSCYEMFYDTRMTATGIQHEHSLHVEKELMDAGFGLVKEAQAGALREAMAVIDAEVQDAEPPNYEENNYDAGYIHGLTYAQEELRARAASIEESDPAPAHVCKSCGKDRGFDLIGIPCVDCRTYKDPQ